MKYKFKIGDRVIREIDIYNPDLGIKKGTVTNRYSKPLKRFPSGTVLGPYDELYEVHWDNGKLEEGFLPHGLDLIDEF